MSARSDILAAIQSAAVPASPAAATVALHTDPTDLAEQFLQMLATVGGCGVVRDTDQSRDRVVATIVADIGASARTDIVVLEGRFGVAENGAVYVDAADLDARVEIVRSAHLILVVPRAALVRTMHDAVRLIPAGSACGWFISGPSKTADIEQALVVGAQGARSLHVILEST